MDSTLFLKKKARFDTRVSVFKTRVFAHLSFDLFLPGVGKANGSRKIGPVFSNAPDFLPETTILIASLTSSDQSTGTLSAGNSLTNFSEALPR